MESMEIILNELEKIEGKNCRTVIFYENIYPALALFKKIFSGRENVNLLVFSNNTMRQLRRIAGYLNLDISSANTILVSRKASNSDASRIFRFDDIESLLNYIETLKGTLIVLCRANIKIVLNNYPELVFEILERTDDNLRIYAMTNFYCHTEIEREMISNLFDVSIILKKQEEYFGFGEEVYEFHIVQSIFPDIQPGVEYFRIDPMMEMISR